MNQRVVQRAEPVLLGGAIVLGLAIAAVDNIALEGEVSPIIVVGLLLAATALLAFLGSRRAWRRALAVWIWVPLAHVVKHMLGMRDTLHPNTYASIAMLGAFSLIVALVGTACGAMARRVVSGRTDLRPTNA